ncbi:MAG: hypothetical protein ACJ8F1_24815 [Polyangia bacterium]
MTPAAAVLFVFVTHGAAGGPADDVVAACLRALPAGTRPLTQTAPEAPGDAVLVASATAAGAVAGVVVAWAAADLPRAEVRAVVGLPDHARWVSRTVTFAPADQLPERERALGLVIASIVQEGFASPPDRAPPRGHEPPGALPLDSPAVVVAKAAPVPVTPVAEDGDRTAWWAVEAGVTTAYESGTDPDDTIGGTLAVRRFLLPHWALRLGAAFRLNQRDQPDVTGLALIGALGAGWLSPRFGPGGRFGAGARADLLVQQQTVRVSGYPLVTGDQGYWSMGADVLAEFGVGLARGTMLLASAGLEEMFTEADVVVKGQDVATLRHARAVLQIGVLSRF